MPFRLVQIVSDFKHHRDLGGEGAGAANILLRNPSVVQTVEHAEHAQHFSVSAQQGHGQQLLGLVLCHHFEIHASELGQIVGPEYFLLTQGAGGDALWKNCVHSPRMAANDGTANPEHAIFKQSDKAPAVAEKIGGAHHERLQKMFEIAAGTQFRGDIQQLMQFMGLALRGGAQFGVSHGDCAEAGNGRKQRFLLRGKGSLGARIDENCALLVSSAKRRSQQHSRSDHRTERVQLASDRNADNLAGGDRALRHIGGEADRLPVMAGAKGVRQLRGVGRDAAQFEGSLTAQKN